MIRLKADVNYEKHCARTNVINFFIHTFSDISQQKTYVYQIFVVIHDDALFLAHFN